MPDYAKQKNCDLVMSGSEKHLVPAALDHAVLQHKHERTPKLEAEMTNNIIKNASRHIAEVFF